MIRQDYSTAESVEKFNPLRMKVSSYREDAFRAGMQERPGRKRIRAKHTRCGSGSYVGTVRAGEYTSITCHKQSW